MIVKPFKLAVELKSGDGGLVPYTGTIVTAKIDVVIDGDKSTISGTILDATKDKKPAKIPGLKFPRTFGPYPAGQLLQADSGTETLRVTGGTLTVDWKSMANGDTSLTIKGETSTIASMLASKGKLAFNSATLKGKARPYRPVVVPAPTPTPVPAPPVAGQSGALDDSTVWKAKHHTFKIPPKSSGRISINTRGIKHQTTRNENGGHEYFWLDLRGNGFHRVTLFSAAEGSRKVRCMISPENMQMEIASDNQPDEVTWTFVFGGGRGHFELNGKMIGKPDAFTGSVTKIIAGGSLDKGRHFKGEWRSLRVE